MFRFAYPSERDIVPDWLMTELLARTLDTVREGNWDEQLCRGNLMSKVNYHVDIQHWGYGDGRKWDEDERAETTRGGAPWREGSELEDSAGSGR